MAARRVKSSRRSFLKTCAGLAAGLGIFGSCNPWAHAQTRAPVALSLNIGLNAVDPNKWSGWSGPLRGPEQDAKDMAAIAKKSGRFKDVIELLGPRANRTEVLRHIAWAAAVLKPKDLFFITYSGHGSQTNTDPSRDEADDRRDETWCLFDGHLVDDILYQFWGRFADDVRIIVFSDSCHSGTVAKTAETLALAEAKTIDLPPVLKDDKVRPPIEALKGDVAAFDKLEKGAAAPTANDLSAYSYIKAMPEFLVEPVEQAQAADLKTLQDAYPNAIGEFKSSTESIGARGLLFGACEDDRQALDGSPNSVFTAAVKTAFGDVANSNLTYGSLFNAIKSRPTPKLFGFGQSDQRFLNEKIFTIG